MNIGLMVTIGVFVLAVIFGLVLRADKKKTSRVLKTEKADTVATTPVPTSVGEVESEPESWRKSAERFRRHPTDS